MALLKLGENEKAKECFNNLINHGQEHVSDESKVDYFAVSLPDLLIWDDIEKRRNLIHCLYLIGLGNLGLGQTKEADEYFHMVLMMDPNHTGTSVHLRLKI